MKKRGLIGILILVFAISLSFVNAQDVNNEDPQDPNEDINDESFKEESQNIDFNAELRSPGITPDSTFYFVEDSILTRFRTDLENTEKKASEIRAMIRDGKIKKNLLII